MKIVIHLLFVITGSTTILAKIPANITLATTDWAPYTSGYSPDKPGIVHEYITEVLAQHNINVEIEHYPWSRAVMLANTGDQVHGLLTAVYEEAPELMFTSTPIMNHKMSFYTMKESNWEYLGVGSLDSMPTPLGVTLGYGYGFPIDAYIKDKNNIHNVLKLTGNNTQARLVKLLDYQRARVIIEDELVVRSTTNASTDIRYAGTLSESPFYLAFNPQLSWSKDIIALLDNALALPENLLLLDEIVAKYEESAEHTIALD